MTKLEGGCSCGAVRYRLKDRPMFTNCCHCLDCQRQTGSAFVINAIIETDRIELIGEAPQPVRMATDSGRPHDIYRCAKCETAVWSDYGGRPWARFVRVGTLDDPTQIAPDAHIFARTKQPWVGLPKDAAVFDIFYDMAAQWPAQSLARRQAAMTAPV
jgi:hypothetical protein